jgi:hypothetical protein
MKSAILFVFLPVIAFAADDTPDGAHREISGKWFGVGIRSGCELNFAGDKLTVATRLRSITVPYSLGVVDEVKNIELDTEHGPHRGIYRIKGDSMTLWMSDPAGETMPKGFDKPPSVGVVRYIFVRKKPTLNINMMQAPTRELP